MKNPPSLAKLLKRDRFPRASEGPAYDERFEALQRAMVRVQQGVWHRRARVIIAIEGFDAAGKGGAIRRLVEELDPRGFKVHAIGAPTADELGQHYLQRFWRRLPVPGQIAIFDRTWYGRVLVEKVDRLTPKPRLRQAYEEINAFERQLRDDGIDLIKIFLGISAPEQLRRFKDRLEDPYKRWKISEDDIRARRRWKDYVRATDEMFERTHAPGAHWHLVPADDKLHAREEALHIVTHALRRHGHWLEQGAAARKAKELQAELKRLS